MKMKGILIVVMSIGVLSIFAQGSLEGNLKDENKDALFGANIMIYQGDSLIDGTTSDIDGFYFLDNIKEGTYQIKISSFTAKMDAQTIKIKDRETFTFSTTLSSVNAIDGADVYGTKHPDLFDRENPTVEIVSTESFIETGIKDVDEMVAMTPSTITDKNGDVSYRGSRPGNGAYYVDGQRISGELSIPTSAIYEIEIHNGGIPAKYGNTTSAVVSITTKSYFDFFE